MHRFYLAPENWNPDALMLRDAEAHHARDVLRMERGDRVVIFNGRGREITAEIVELAKHEIRLRKLQASETQPLRCRITLGQAIPKGKNMDLIVQKAVEIGAAEISPLISERTIVDLDQKEAEQKREKWQQIAVEAAKQYGKRIAIHSYGPVGGRDAVLAGATTLEHAIDLDDATLAEMVKRGTFYVPTIDHNRYYAEYAKDFRYTPQQVAALDSFRLLNIATAKKAFQAGVKFGMGSDAVFHMFGQNTRELGFYAQIGMTPAQALATATVNGAALLGMETKLGRIAPGYFADIVAVEGDPLADIGVVIDKVKWVMKGGSVVVDKR
jgi:imidazolonepropionase-like amidohydrolase